MSTAREVVEAVLAELAAGRDVDAGASPREILLSSLDQMRLLVGIEDRLDVVLDVGDAFPFDLSSREALMLSVENLLASDGSLP